MEEQFASLAGTKIDIELIAADLANCTVHLYKHGMTPTPTTARAELQANEADFDGYAAAAIAAWSNPCLAPGGGYMVVSPLLSWHMTGSTTPNTIGGMWVQDANDVVRYIVRFGAGVEMDSADSCLKRPIAIVQSTGI